MSVLFPKGNYLSAGRIAEELVLVWATSEQDEWVDRIQNLPLHDKLTHAIRTRTPARIDKPDSGKLEGYRADGGYDTFERALEGEAAGGVVTQVKDSGLRGRGGAGSRAG